MRAPRNDFCALRFLARHTARREKKTLGMEGGQDFRKNVTLNCVILRMGHMDFHGIYPRSTAKFPATPKEFVGNLNVSSDFRGNFAVILR